MFNIQFEYPYVFLILVIFFICFKFCKAKSATYFMPHLTILVKNNEKTFYIIELLKYLVVIFAVLALASPVKIKNTQLIKNDGIDIVLSLDSSKSMSEQGFDKFNFEKNRFDIVKDIVKDFISKRVNDNIALVVFGSKVMTASTLSFDKMAQQEILTYLDIAIAGNNTALIDSIAQSIKILKSSKAKSKVIVVLSDGEDNSSTIPIDIIKKLLKKYNIKLYAISIASNSPLMSYLVNSANGKYFKANSKEDLIEVYEKINNLEKSKIEQNKIVLKEYLYFYPLFIAIIILILLIYLKNKE